MYMLEVKTQGEWEVYHFPTIEKVLDYIYMVEGESYLPEYRNEFQRKAPGTHDIKGLFLKPGLFFLWEIATYQGHGAIRYILSYMKISKSKHFRYTFPKLSKYWGTVYGIDTVSIARMEKARDINSDDVYMGVN